MLEQLFGSRTRVKLLRLFLSHPTEHFFVRELSRTIHEHINSIRRELQHLVSLGLLQMEVREHKKYYTVDTKFNLYPELKALIVKSRVTLEKKFISQLQSMGKVQYLALLGYFMDDTKSATDLFIVGEVSNKKLQELLEEFTKQFGHELRYTLMSSDEYKYRADVTDKFLFSLLHSPQLSIVNSLSPQLH